VLIIIVVLAIAAILLGAWSASTAVEQKQSSERSLQAVAVYGGGTTVREQEMLETVGDRVLAPVAKGFMDIARRLTPAGYVQSVKTRIVLAGSPPGFEVDRFLAAKVLATGSILLWVLLVHVVLGMGGLVGFLLIGGLSAAAFFAPELVLNQKVTERRTQIERTLPDMLDLLVISVEAGLGFEQALERTTTSVPGPLSEEARRMLQEIRMGASRADALRALEERTQVDDLRGFVLAMLQADSFGISVGRILKTQADEMRIRRRQQIQERAQKMPIKMLFPLVLCVFPAIFVVLLVPGMITILDSLA
jgi:tight adherence protein C